MRKKRLHPRQEARSVGARRIHTQARMPGRLLSGAHHHPVLPIGPSVDVRLLIACLFKVSPPNTAFHIELLTYEPLGTCSNHM